MVTGTDVGEGSALSADGCVAVELGEGVTEICVGAMGAGWFL